MPHLAALVPAAKAPLEVKEVDTPQPGPHELLIKNEIIALQPVEAKIAKVAMLPLQYPAILGSAFAGTVEKVGPEVSGFNVGDKVVVYKKAWINDNKYSAYQQFVVSSDITTTKVANDATLETAVRLVGNLPTVPALFNATLNLARPDFSGEPQSQGKKILIYGGTSSIGSLSVQYLKQAGYDVVTTTSPQHKHFVSQLGASQIVDHTQLVETVSKELISAGPYEIVLDTISTAETIKLNAEVVAAHGGGNVYALQPPFAPDTLPDGVQRVFEGWSFLFGKGEHDELLEWTFGTYFPQALSKDSLRPVAEKKVLGGLSGINDGLNLLFPKGVSSEKVVVDLRK